MRAGAERITFAVGRMVGGNSEILVSSRSQPGRTSLTSSTPWTRPKGDAPSSQAAPSAVH